MIKFLKPIGLNNELIFSSQFITIIKKYNIKIKAFYSFFFVCLVRIN